MRSSRVISRRSPRALLTSIASQFLHLPLNGQTGTDKSIIPNLGNFGPTSLTLAGTTTNVWSARPGWLLPSGDNYVSFSLSDPVNRGFFRLDTLEGVGGILAMLRMRRNDPTTVGATILSATAYSNTAGYGGGYEFAVGSGANFNIQHAGSAGGSITTLTQGQVTEDLDSVGLVYLDCVSGTIYGYRDGTSRTSAALPAALPPLDDTISVDLFRRRRRTLTENYMGAAGNDTAVGDLTIVRVLEDIQPDLAYIHGLQRQYAFEQYLALARAGL